ncbi:MAG: hypothetical protein GC160_15490 [Acidobacteria bacterium]|nr:hypothetical protein [Acidobacteriota bacterium]
MPSSAKPSLEAWNKKLHIYLGLYFLFFLWLFVFTGLLLNHPLWRFAEFWPQRIETSYERSIDRIPAEGDLERAQSVMQQLGLAGEIDWPPKQPGADRLEFSVNRPGNMNRVSVDLAANRASVQHIEINAWGVMHVLHTFSGTRANNPEARRDWSLTTLWVLAMDALAAGLILMVLSSYYMCWRLHPKRRAGSISLAAGVVVCGFFVFGLSWL